MSYQFKTTTTMKNIKEIPVAYCSSDYVDISTIKLEITEKLKQTIDKAFEVLNNSDFRYVSIENYVNGELFDEDGEKVSNTEFNQFCEEVRVWYDGTITYKTIDKHDSSFSVESESFTL